MIEQVIKRLIDKRITLSCAESFTGGKFASTITSYKGVSAFFKGGIVSYWNEVKENILKVSSDMINSDGVISASCAKEMLLGTKKLMNTDFVISFTGNAGPTSMENKPAGLVYIGVMYLDDINIYELNLNGSRSDVQNQAIEFAFEKILQILEKNNTNA